MLKWNSEKNELLFAERGVTFDEVALAVAEGAIIEDYPHPNQAKYPKQRVFEVLIREYAYLVPYVHDGDDIFLKTIIPSRKAMRKHKGK